MTALKPVFPAPDHDHVRCAADALTHAEGVCRARRQNLTPIRRHVLQALLATHRPLGAYEIIESLARKATRPAPITVYRALDFLIENGWLQVPCRERSPPHVLGRGVSGDGWCV